MEKEEIWTPYICPGKKNKLKTTKISKLKVNTAMMTYGYEWHLN